MKYQTCWTFDTKAYYDLSSHQKNVRSALCYYVHRILHLYLSLWIYLLLDAFMHRMLFVRCLQVSLIWISLVKSE